MPLFNNKELEALQSENRRLQTELEQLQTREDFHRTTILSLNQGVEKLRDHLLSQEQDISAKDAEISDLAQRLAAVSTRPYNERGAGRKRKATLEQILLIRSLRMEGKSYGAIARILTEQYGDKWNRATVRNTFIAEKN